MRSKEIKIEKKTLKTATQNLFLQHKYVYLKI